MDEITREIVMLPVDCLFPHPDNPRKDLGDLSELTESVKINGVLQNLTVVPDESGPADKPQFIVVIGHRRLAAAKLAGLTELPCVIADRMTPEEQVAVMLTENIQRSALTPYEEAKGFEQLRIDFGKSVKEIVKLSGFSETTVRNRLKLTKLDADKFNASFMRGGRMEDYLELDNIRDPDLRNQLLDQIGTNNFRNALKSAIKQKRLQSTLERWEKEASAFAKRIDKTDSSGKAFVYYYTARGDQSQTIKRPDDAGTVKYYYETDSAMFTLTLYREKTETDKEKDAAREAVERERKADDARKAELKEITERHFALRREFVAGFLHKRDYEPYIMRYAADVIIGNGTGVRYGSCYHISALAALMELDEEIDEDNEDFNVVKERIMRESEAGRGMALKLLLCAAFVESDSENNQYWENNWNAKKNKWELIHKYNPALDRLYGLLTSIGYEMSDEELQMQNGTHPLFRSGENYSKRH